MTKFNTIATGLMLSALAFQWASAENVILTTPQNFQVVGMSPNGKWACGVFIGAGDTSSSFRWNLETGKVDMLGIDEESIAWGVADDGTVAGYFASKEVLPFGNPILSAGIARGNSNTWETLEIPEGTDKGSEGFGYSITADGRSVSGTVQMNNILTPVIWRDGKVHKIFESPKHSMAYCISPDGETVAGWSYGPKYSNRAATYWSADGKINYLLDSPEWSETMFNSAKAFSPDGKKLLYWGGWDPVKGENGEYVENYLYALYDIESGERTKIKAPAVNSTMEFFAMTNDGLLVGSDNERGFIYQNGEGMFIDDYLKSIGVDLTGYPDFYKGEGLGNYMPIFRVQSVTGDGKTFIFIFTDSEAVMRSMCLKVDQDLTAVAPVGFTAQKMNGLNSVALNWMAPLQAKGIRGYNIYRGEKKLNGFLPLNKLSYYDSNLENGTYIYKVAAVNAAGIETFAEEIEVTVDDMPLSAPVALSVRQKGVNDAYATWQAPEKNLIHMRYYNPESTIMEPMSVYQDVEVEMGVKYDANELAQYAGATVKEVSFLPMGEQYAWTIVFYTRDDSGKLVELATQPVTQEVKVRETNTVKLDNPLTLPKGDLILAMRVSVNSANPGVLAADNSNSRPGYSDLLRQTSEADFYSTFEVSSANAQNISYNSWAIGMSLEMSGYEAEKDVVDHYNLYVDGTRATETTETAILLPGLEEGTHTIGVEAVYADGGFSAVKESCVDINPAYEPVMNVETAQTSEGGDVIINATWKAPTNVDRLVLSYDPAEDAITGVKGINNALIIGSEYTSSMLKGYEGYLLESVSFYPLCDAIYTVSIWENGVVVHEQEVYDFEAGKWCDIALDKDIRIKENADYRVVVDAFDAEPGMPIFGLGEELAFPYRSDLYSLDGGLTYNSYKYETGSKYGWLMKMSIAEVDGQTFEPVGYDVVVDKDVKNSQPVTETSYAVNMGADAKGLHSMTVNAYYSGVAEAVPGKSILFRVTSSGIDGTFVGEYTLRRNGSRLEVDGEGVESIALLAVSGTEVASALGNTLEVADVTPGVYVVRIKTSATTIIRKIQLTK